MKKPDGGPVFPTKQDRGPMGSWNHPGMTMRDWFAGMALAGLCSKDGYEPGTISTDAYVIAEVMLEERMRE